MRKSLALMAVFLTAASASGQFGFAELSGIVTARDGAPLHGAVVIVRSAETGLTRSATTTQQGTYTLTALKPGRYVLTFQLDGFSTATFHGVEARLGKTTDVSTTMEVASITDSINVTAKPHVVDLRSRSLGDTLTSRDFRDLPSQNRSFVLFGALVPGVVPNPQTNSSSGEALYINGQHQANNSFRVDGARNDDDIVGSQSGAQVRTPMEAIQEFQILTSQYDAEFGGATGGILNAITKSGTNDVKGSAFGFLQRAEWNAQNYFGELADLAQPHAQFRSAGFTLGGPVLRDRLHYFLSLEDVDDQEGHTRFFASRPDLSFSTTEANEIRNVLGRVDLQVTPRQQVSVRYLAEDAPQLNKIPTAQTTLEGASEEHDFDQNSIAGLESILSDSAINSLRLSYTHEHLINAASPFGRWADGFDALRSAAPLLRRPSVDEGPSIIGRDEESSAVDVANTFSLLVPQGKAMHEIRAGFQWTRRELDNRQFGNANGRFDFNTDRTFDPNDITTYPFAFTVRVRGPARATATATEMLGLFVQDDIPVRPNLILSAGLRWDREDVVADDNNFAPRLGFAWSPAGPNRTVVRGGVGRFYGRLLLSSWSLFQLDAVQAPVGFLFRLPDAGMNRQFFFDLARRNGVTSLTELRDLLVRTLDSEPMSEFNLSPTVDHPDRVQPHVDTITLGIDREVLPGMAAGIDFVHSRSRNTLILVDLNPFSAARGGRPNISVRHGNVVPMGTINTFVNAGNNRYDALQLSVRKRIDGRFGGRIAYTYADSKGNYGNALPLGGPNTAYFQTRSESGYNFDTGEIIGEPLRLNLDDPRNAGQPVGWHRRHNFLITGVWAVPGTSWRENGGLSLSWMVRYMSGDRLTIFTTEFLDNGNRAPAAPGSYDATIASDIGQNDVAFSGTMFGAENPAFSRVDASLRYAIPLSYRDAQLTLIGDVFNATGRTNFVNAGGTIAGSAGFLTPTATFSPREFQVGARLSF